MKEHIAQKELNRLVSYAEGLGITVVWKDYQPGDPGGMFIYPNEPLIIELYVNLQNIKPTETILIMLHELGHMHDWLNSGKRDPGEVHAKEHDELNRTEREAVYKSERNATVLSVKIAKMLDLKYPAMYKIKSEAALDRWVYRVFMKTGTQPSRSELRKKSRQLRAKYKRLDEESNEKE